MDSSDLEPAEKRSKPTKNPSNAPPVDELFGNGPYVFEVVTVEPGVEEGYAIKEESIDGEPEANLPGHGELAAEEPNYLEGPVKIETSYEGSQDSIVDSTAPHFVSNAHEQCESVSYGSTNDKWPVKIEPGGEDGQVLDTVSTGGEPEPYVTDSEAASHERTDPKRFAKIEKGGTPSLCDLSRFPSLVVPTTGALEDVIPVLLSNPFSKLSEAAQRAILRKGRPTPDIEVTREERKKNGHSYKRCFNSQWFSRFRWLCVSATRKTLFCWPCLLLSNARGPWNSTGYSDIKNLTTAAKKHEASREHIGALIGVERLEKNSTDVLNVHHKICKADFNNKVRINRLIVALEIEAIILLGRTEQPFRGNDESSTSLTRGNFVEILDALINNGPPDVKKHYEDHKLIFSEHSHSVQNELIELIHSEVEDNFVKQLNDAQFFSIQVDDVTDLTEKCQLTIIVRFIDSAGDVCEHFLGFVDVSNGRDALSLFGVISRRLGQFHYEKKLVAQCYDGSGLTSGPLNGLPSKIKEKAPRAFFVHCYAHKLNQVLMASCEGVRGSRIFFAFIDGLSAYFHGSPHRREIALNVIDEKLPQLALTRWWSRSRLLSLVASKWDGFKIVLQTLIDDPKSSKETISGADGFLNKFNNFHFAFLVQVFNEIFMETDILFESLQQKTLNIPHCSKKLSETKDTILDKRCDAKFKMIYGSVLNSTDLPVGGKASDPVQFESDMKNLFFEVIDHITAQLDWRFHDFEQLSFVKLADQTRFSEFATCLPLDTLKSLQTFYPKLFLDLQKLKGELATVYNDKEMKILPLTKLLKYIVENGLSSVLEESYRLFSLIATIPSSSSSAERSFSCLKRIKTYLRNSRGQERSSALSGISINKQRLLDLKNSGVLVNTVIERFAHSKSRKIDLIYKD